MKIMLKFAVGAGLFALAACGGQGDDALGDNVADAAEAQAENLQAASENAASEVQSDQLEEKAEAVSERGEQMEEAIDDADVNAQGVAETPQEPIVNGM